MEICTVIMFLMVVAGGSDPVSLRADLDPRCPDLSFGDVWEVPARYGLVQRGWPPPAGLWTAGPPLPGALGRLQARAAGSGLVGPNPGI